MAINMQPNILPGLMGTGRVVPTPAPGMRSGGPAIADPRMRQQLTRDSQRPQLPRGVLPPQASQVAVAATGKNTGVVGPDVMPGLPTSTDGPIGAPGGAAKPDVMPRQDSMAAGLPRPPGLPQGQSMTMPRTDVQGKPAQASNAIGRPAGGLFSGRGYGY